MIPPRQPLFLERQSYRRRRLIDASRVIPVFGLCLFLVPLLWPKATQGEINLALRGLYIFGVWFLLVGFTGLVSYRLQNRADETRRRDSDATERRHVL